MAEVSISLKLSSSWYEKEAWQCYKHSNRTFSPVEIQYHTKQEAFARVFTGLNQWKYKWLASPVHCHKIERWLCCGTRRNHTEAWEAVRPPRIQERDQSVTFSLSCLDLAVLSCCEWSTSRAESSSALRGLGALSHLRVYLLAILSDGPPLSPEACSCIRQVTPISKTIFLDERRRPWQGCPHTQLLSINYKVQSIGTLLLFRRPFQLCWCWNSSRLRIEIDCKGELPVQCVTLQTCNLMGRAIPNYITPRTEAVFKETGIRGLRPSWDILFQRGAEMRYAFGAHRACCLMLSACFP